MGTPHRHHARATFKHLQVFLHEIWYKSETFPICLESQMDQDVLFAVCHKVFIFPHHRTATFPLLLPLVPEPNNPQFPCTNHSCSFSFCWLQSSPENRKQEAKALKWADWFVHSPRFLSLSHAAVSSLIIIQLAFCLQTTPKPTFHVKRLRRLALLRRKVIKMSIVGFLRRSFSSVWIAFMSTGRGSKKVWRLKKRTKEESRRAWEQMSWQMNFEFGRDLSRYAFNEITTSTDHLSILSLTSDHYTSSA